MAFGINFLSQVLTPLKPMGIFLEKGHKEIISLAWREVFHGLRIGVQENLGYLL